MLDTAVSFDSALRPSPEAVAAVLPVLPSAPCVLPRLTRLLRYSDVPLQQVSNLVRLDPGLTAQVLQLGNSQALARGERCFSIEDAINMIGYDAVTAMVARVAKSQVLVRPVSLYGIDADELWRWSITCALAAELLAELTGEEPGLAYTIGLLHGIGIVAIDEWALQNEPTLMFMSRGVITDYVESERSLLGFTQASVSAALLRRWDFPVGMIEPVRWQYTPHASAGYARMSCLLYAAKWLRSAVCAEETRPPFLPAASILDPLHLTGERLARCVVEVRIRLGEVRNLVGAAAA